MAAKRPPALDRIDVKILSTLQRSGRMTIQKLAETVGLSSRPCLERVRRLEAAGVIAGYQAVIDLAKLSRPVTVFSEVVLEKLAHKERFEKHLLALAEVVECWEVTGASDYLVRFVCADVAAYEELTTALIDHPHLGVARVVSHIVLRPVRKFGGYPAALLARKPER
jgi:DNA-binding Lrp family transcriptional regulator